MGRLFGLLYDEGYQVADVRRLKEKHFALYIERRKGEGLSLRTLQNEAAHIRESMRAVGRNQAADSPTISNKALEIDGSCRDGTKVAATDEEFQKAIAIAGQIDEGLAAALKLQRWLGLRGAESVRAGPSLRTWEKNLIDGAPVTVIYGTKGGRSRQTKPADAARALEAVREALAVAAKRGDRIIERPTLKVAMKWYTNTMHREVTDQVGIQAHALRYAYACDLLDLYQEEGFSKAEAEAQTSMDLGHGDGRGRYVRKVYLRRAGAYAAISSDKIRSAASSAW